MAIRPEADVAYLSRHKDEREIALKLHESFDITTSGRPMNRLSFWIAKPNTSTAERFGLNQEILVIYSPHRTTDARVPTTIEEFLRQPEFRHRLDKSLCLLIHNGEQQATQDLLRRQVDRIIVPFQASELLDPNRGDLFIRSRMSEVVGQIDLFGMSSPITADKYFFGRNDLVQEFVRTATNRNQNTGLFGPRKTGKTSVLRAIERRLQEQSVLVEYVDCSNPGVHAARWWQVLEDLSRRLIRNSGSRAWLKPPAVGSYTQETAGARFLADVKTLLDGESASSIVIMLDEIEYITAGLNLALGQHWDTDFIPFWQVIRSTHQESRNKLVFIVAGVNPASVNQPQFGGITNPIFGLENLQFLEPFDRSRVREMVRSIGRFSGIAFDEATYAYLQEEFGGHPFLIRIACSEVWKAIETIDSQTRIPLGSQDFVRMQPEIKARLAQPIKDILLSLIWWYPDEYDILQILASGEVDFVDDYIGQNPELIIQFSKYGVLRKDHRGEFAMRHMNDFLITHGQEYKRELSPFRTSDIPAELLPQVPDLELLTHFFKLRTDVEIRLRRAIMLYMQVERSFDPGKIAAALAAGLKPRNDRKNPADLFVGRPPEAVMN